MDYKFLGVELMGLIEGWIEDERQGVLNTEPPLSPPISEAKNVGISVGNALTNGAPELAPSANVEEEAVASNPPLTAEDPTSTANEATSGFTGRVALINL